LGPDVAVSKLCCPSCWDYFGISREKKEKYAIRGRHSTVYPLQLPVWANPVIVQELIEIFAKHLRNQLAEMMENHRGTVPGHKHSPSLESMLSCVTSSSEVSATSNREDLNRRVAFPQDGYVT
jgi:hypothetical protein